MGHLPSMGRFITKSLYDTPNYLLPPLATYATLTLRPETLAGKGNMSTDAVIFLIGMAGLLVGFVWGRWERNDQQTRTYRHGFNIGKQVGRNEGK